MPGPLAGYRVLDLSAFITGPLATMLLGDQGAEVIKVEPLGLGDVLRYAGTARGGMSAIFANCNRSKRAIALNLREERGRELLGKLVVEADVLVQNFRPGVVERLGIDEASLRKLQPDLIYVSLSAFGEQGPYAQRPAFDHIVQGMSGMAYVQADPDTGEPDFVRNAACDKITAYAAAQAITAALLARERGAGGQHVRINMLDTAVAFLWPDGMANLTILEDDVQVGAPVSAAYRLNPVLDGYLTVVPLTDAQAQGLFRAINREDLIEDPRFGSLAGRMQHLDELIRELEPILQGFRVDELIERLVQEDVPCGPVLSPEQLPEHPQIQANQTLVESEHPQLGHMRQPRPSVRYERTPAEISAPAPTLGAHTDEILLGIGLSRADIADLRSKGIAG